MIVGKKVQDINDQLGIERKGELVYAMPCPFVICKMAEIIISLSHPDSRVLEILGLQAPN